ncbi:ABSCISIC ACID-INSENSITIVE 5-like protein 2 [Rutidosis leptorrhynchoides]|uniref:ABSCISIC ACID-INSENSITIVE 5-like protein 2 n=1 Tax=Rutidosis leptorrhynchoides TaxID=125765 RepID=UPI003A993C8F
MGSNGGGNSEPQLPKAGNLGRQGSLYNLTLDEVQTQFGDLGKPLTSMNLDELLKSVWTAENTMNVESHHGPPGSGPLAQPSSIALSQDLRKRTVDEVWQDIQLGHKTNGNGMGTKSKNNDVEDTGGRERQPTLGEMTLEDFLVKAGIVEGGTSLGSKNADSNVSNQQSIVPQQTQWVQYQVAPIQQQHVYMTSHHPGQQSLSIGANAMMEIGYPETQMTMSPSSLMHNLSDTHTPGRKRVASGDVIEKSVERRQKRMIKNRESAARSRARKQAYTQELENKISRLEEENERLKRQKDVGKVLPSAPPPKPKYQLRRTTSAPF